MSSSVEPELDRKIGKFQLIRPIGAGGMGRVYLARQEKLDRLVAIKILHPDLAQDEVFLERFFREARAAAVFQHPHVVAVIDADQDEKTGDHYIAFEYIEGASLEELVKIEIFKERRTLEIMRDIVKALCFAESKGIVHRDVKPDNILVGNDGVPKLADLGLAKSFEGEQAKTVTQTGVIVGTPLYMAPEQALGYEAVDIRADIYSLGLCIWRMLTGLTPFDEDGETSSLHILSRHINEDLPDVRSRNPDVSESVSTLVTGMTARERVDRYSSAAALLAEMERILAGQAPIGPQGEGGAGATQPMSQAAIQQSSSRNTAKTETIDPNLYQSGHGWAGPKAGKPNGLARTALVVVLLGAVAWLAYFGRDSLPIIGGGTAAVATSTDTPNTGNTPTAGTEDPDTGSAGTPTIAPPPPVSSVPSPDLKDERSVVAHVKKTSKLLFLDVAKGIDHLNALKLASGWEQQKPLKNFVDALDGVTLVLDPEAPANERKRGKETLSKIVDEQRKHIIPGRIAAAVDRELTHWNVFVTGLDRLQLALSDPRAIEPTKKALAKFPPEYKVTEHVTALIELGDFVDFSGRWSGSKKRLIEVAKRRKAIQESLAGTAVGTSMRIEIRAIGSLIFQLLHDPQRSLLTAVYVVGKTEAGKGSKFLAARRRDVPQGASLRDMRARGLIVEVTEPWKAGQSLTVLVGRDTKFVFDGKGLKGKPIRWGPTTVILVEPRRQDVLLRLPDASSGEFTRRHSPMGSPRFSITTTKKVELKVSLVVLPSRSAK
jgi:serine/threonine protein kinase